MNQSVFPFQQTRFVMDRDIEIIVLYGPAGTGKSWWARYHYPNAYHAPDSTYGNKCMLVGYEGQDTVVYSGFVGHDTRSPHIARLFDFELAFTHNEGSRHPSANATRFVFTSNVHPRAWYTQPCAAFKKKMRKYGRIIKTNAAFLATLRTEVEDDDTMPAPDRVGVVYYDGYPALKPATSSSVRRLPEFVDAVAYHSKDGLTPKLRRAMSTYYTRVSRPKPTEREIERMLFLVDDAWPYLAVKWLKPGESYRIDESHPHAFFKEIVRTRRVAHFPYTADPVIVPALSRTGTDSE
jgi:hypothetical protein